MKTAVADGAGYLLTPTVGCPVIIHVPHAGLTWPDDSTAQPDHPGLSDEIRLMADLHVDEIAHKTATLVSGRTFGERVPGLLINRLSRVAMDPERFDDDTEEMNQVGMGVVYTKTHTGELLYSHGLPDVDVERRKTLWYRPYAAVLSALVDDTLAQHGRCLIVDLHSYATRPLPYERHQVDGRPQVCLGFEPFHDPGIDRVEQVFAAHGFQTARNQPFQGSYVPLKHWQVNPAVKSVMIEIRKDQYLDGQDIRPVSVLNLATAVAGLIEAIALGIQSP